MLSVQGIHTYYGKSHILQGVSLEISEGEVVALLGRNGVGKTTLLKSIMGITPPKKGVISLRSGREAHRYQFDAFLQNRPAWDRICP